MWALQQGECYDARRLKNVQNKIHLGQPVLRSTRPLPFCGFFLAGRTSISSAE